jgi:serine/threonine-protein kinase
VTDARYVPTGHIVYAASGTLRAVAFDAARLEVTSSPVPVIEGVLRSILGAHYDFSRTGSLVYLRGPATLALGAGFALFDRQGKITPLKLPPGPYSTPRVSRDGKQLAFQSDTAQESMIWIYDIAGGVSARRLTFGGKNRFPAWLPDGTWVSFQSDRDGDLAVFRQRADGSGTAERLTKPEPDTAHIPYSWAPDGKTLLFEIRKGTAGSLWTFSIDDKQMRRFADVENRNPIDASFSPDGRWVAYTSQETGLNEVFVQPFPATGAKYQIPFSADNHAPLWLHGGNELYYLPGPGRFFVVRILLEPGFSVSDPVTAFPGAMLNAPSVLRQADAMPDGKHILGVLDARNAEPGNISQPPIRVVLDWFSELQQRVPVK